MKLETTGDGSRLVHFRTLPDFLYAVHTGRKSAEVRWLDNVECLELFDEVQPTIGELPAPDRLVLVSTADPTYVIQRQVTYCAAIGTFPGATLVLFCMERLGEQLALGAVDLFTEAGRDADGFTLYRRSSAYPGVVDK